MRSKNYKLHKRGTRLLVYAVVSVISLILLLFAVGESVKKAADSYYHNSK